MATDLLFNRFSEVALRTAEKHGPGEMIFVAVICNGCGCKTVAPTIEELDTEGWTLADEFGGDDFCPRCR